jgi:hypothetical protein
VRRFDGGDSLRALDRFTSFAMTEEEFAMTEGEFSMTEGEFAMTEEEFGVMGK